MKEKLVYAFRPSMSSSEIEIHEDLLKKKSVWEGIKKYGFKFVAIFDEKIASLYQKAFLDIFEEAGLDVVCLTFPSGEQFKTRETKLFLEDQMLENQLGKDTCLMAIGGGVTLDLGGYIASTYCRGIPFVSIPTSLLAMVDACIGGKNGVNTSHGKNMIGNIYQPKKVLIDPQFLKTLPRKELSNGFVEMIKHGMVGDSNHFDYLEEYVEPLLALDEGLIEKAIVDSCRIKKKIVQQDEEEKGQRHVLNLGHTIGHALEKHFNYALTHGEAVAIGLIVESHLACQLGILDKHSFGRVLTLLRNYALPLQLPSKLSLEHILEAMILDKKTRQNLPRFVFIERIGKVKHFDSEYCTSVDKDTLTNSLNWMINDLCCH